MLKYPEPTPCPVHATSPRHLGRYATLSHCTDRDKLLGPGTLPPCDDTERIEFTTELQTAAKQAKPRRRGGTRVRAASVAIHEDNPGDGGLPNTVEPILLQVVVNARRGDIPLQQRQPVTLARRALRASDSAKDAGLSLSQYVQRCGSTYLTKKSQHADAASAGFYTVADQQRSASLCKEPRRRTVFVHSEDTTVLNVHPGPRPEAKARSITDDISYPESLRLPSVKAPATIPADMLRRAPRQSLTAARKRAPLQPTLKPLQERFDVLDRPGVGTGKENVPPGARITRPCIDGHKDPARPAGRSSALLAHIKPTHPSLSNQATAKKRDNSVRQGDRMQPIYIKDRGQHDPLALNKLIFGDVAKRAKQNPAKFVPNYEKRSTCTIPVADVPCKLITPVVSRSSGPAPNLYPLLSEDISRPEMFEEAWLCDKETAITQLINGLYQTTDASEPCRHSNTKSVRQDLLQLYQESSMSLLYSRLQASLLYGALTIPSYRIHDGSRLSTDVGLRRKLLTLWTRTYHLPSLRAAAEVVIGREAQSSLKASAATLHGGDHPRKETRRNLEVFLDSCLIRNEDCERPRRLRLNWSGLDQSQSTSKHEFGYPNWSLRRTMLRSLMLIILLDKAKELGKISGNLFCASSRYKSSASVLKELFSLLLPSAGDLGRSLMHLDYNVCHVQFPLNEYDYKINNLATDLRDGVRLTHLVELLLYPSEALARRKDACTITMPTGQILSSEGQGAWVLSQHLKFPCSGRMQRLYNVQIALSALHGVKGVNPIIEDVRAEDIADGYREKTIALLWGLVGNSESLINVAELRKEIRRLRKQSKADTEVQGQRSHEDEVEPDAEQGLEMHTHLLKAWADAIGRRHGVVVCNLTTAFSDGTVFERIVDEYTPWHQQHWASSAPCGLGRKLKALGCSNYFGM